MSDDLDPRLLARFTAARADLLDPQFLVTCLARLESERRRSAYRLALLCGAGLLLLAWKLPALLAFTAGLAEAMVSDIVVPTVSAVSAPPGISAAGWGISLLLGALALWRTPSLRRRR